MLVREHMSVSRAAAGTRLLVVAGVAATLSCILPTSSCGCDPVPPNAILYGQVLDGAGAPVVGALVRADAGEANCAWGCPSLRAAGVRRSAGPIRSRCSPASGTACRVMKFAPSPPAGSSWGASLPVRFRVTFGTGVPDSARADLVLQAP